VDGFGVEVTYPQDAGVFPGDTSPPGELLAVAVAQYTCSVCVCSEEWQIQVGGEWVPTDAVGYCVHRLKADQDCGGCLVDWFGGCC